LEAGNFPDLIISDLQMPEMNGFEFLEKVKNSGFFDEVPIMILSGGELSNDKIKCFQLGAEDYVVKPFNPSEVIARINRRLEVKERFLSLVG
jgi:DNA-binding response OmpR family regulator